MSRREIDNVGNIQAIVLHTIITLIMVLAWPEVGPLQFFGLAQTIVFWLLYLVGSVVIWINVLEANTKLPRMIGKAPESSKVDSLFSKVDK